VGTADVGRYHCSNTSFTPVSYVSLHELTADDSSHDDGHFLVAVCPHIRCHNG